MRDACKVLLLLRARTGVVFSGSSSETHSLVAFAAAVAEEVEKAAAAADAEAEAEGAGDTSSRSIVVYSRNLACFLPLRLLLLTAMVSG